MSPAQVLMSQLISQAAQFSRQQGQHLIRFRDIETVLQRVEGLVEAIRESPSGGGRQANEIRPAQDPMPQGRESRSDTARLNQSSTGSYGNIELATNEAMAGLEAEPGLGWSPALPDAIGYDWADFVNFFSELGPEVDSNMQ